MQGAASGSTSFSKLIAKREEQKKESLGAHREQMQAHVQGLRRRQSSLPPTATPTTTRSVEPQDGGAGEEIQIRLVMDTKSCELFLLCVARMARVRQRCIDSAPARTAFGEGNIADGFFRRRVVRRSAARDAPAATSAASCLKT